VMGNMMERILPDKAEHGYHPMWRLKRRTLSLSF
jgi:hypothetical protein